MKHLLVTLGLFWGICFSLIAQPGEDLGENKERVEALRIAFLTKRLSLTPDEAQKFWPIYNEYNQALENVRKESQLMRKAMKEGMETMSDKDVEKVADEFLGQRRKELEIVEKYHVQFKKILPIRKVAVLYKSDRDFKRHLLEEMRNRQPGSGPARMGGGPPKIGGKKP